MNTFTPGMMCSQLADVPYLNTHFSMEPTAYSIPDSNPVSASVKSEALDHFMGGTFDDFDLRVDRSLSFSGTSSQSLSPQPPHRHNVPQLPDLGLSTALPESGMEQISPTTSIATSRKDSIDEDHRAEVSLTAQYIRHSSGTNFVNREGELRIEPLSVRIGSARTRV